jgi:hypothetical protein
MQRAIQSEKLPSLMELRILSCFGFGIYSSFST